MTTYEMLNGGQKALMSNLFLIGSAKSGTTSLHSYLSAQPEITRSNQKAPSFFIDQSGLEAGPGDAARRNKLESAPEEA